MFGPLLNAKYHNSAVFGAWKALRRLFWRYQTQKNRRLAPLTWSGFDEIFIVASEHYKLSPPKILWQSDYIKVPKLHFKVKKNTSNFSKVNSYMGAMPKYVREGSIITQKRLLGLLMISKNFGYQKPPKIVFLVVPQTKKQVFNPLNLVRFS